MGLYDQKSKGGKEKEAGEKSQMSSVHVPVPQKDYSHYLCKHAPIKIKIQSKEHEKIKFSFLINLSLFLSPQIHRTEATFH